MIGIGLLHLLMSCANTEEIEEPSVNGDTGVSSVDDTGTFEDPVSAQGCFVELDDSNVLGLNSVWTVGPFEGQVVDNQISIVHSSRIGNPVFDSTSDWVTVDFGELEVTEYQGSFRLEYAATERCGQPLVNRVLADSDAVMIEGVFEDESVYCEDLSFSMFLCPESDERLHFALDVQTISTVEEPTRTTLHLTSSSSERIMGMGEQFPHDSLNLKGRRIPALSQEGGVGRGHPVITPLIEQFSRGSGGSEATTYFAMPHYLTTEQHSVFLHNTEVSEFDFTADDEIAIEVYSTSIVGEALYGQTPLELIETFTEYTGRMPEPPEWIDNGAIVALARPLEESESIVAELLDAGAAISGVWNQTWSGINRTFIGEQVLWNWEQGEYDHPNWEQWVGNLNAQDIQVLCYVNSMFLDVSGHESNPDRNLYAEGIAGDYFVHDENGQVLTIPVTAFDVVLLDFTNPDAVEWMKDVIKDEMVDNAGCRGWMVDFAEALPFEAHLFDGTPASAYHNQYPVDWMKLNRQAIYEMGMQGEILTFNRAGYTRTPGYSLMTWQGDQLTTWDKYDGLQSAIRGLINGGLSGISLNHSDIGGYTSISQLGFGYSREAQLLKRWSEFSAFTSLMRTHEGNQPTANAQVYSDDAQRAQFARMTKVYTALSEYRRDLFREAELTGVPVVRHLWLHYPDDPVVFDHELQFLLGRDILVAPHVEKCLLPWCDFAQDVYLPEDTWVHLWSGDVYTGGDTVSVNAPIGYPAVFYRQNSVVMSDVLDAMRDAGLDVHP